MASQWGSSVMLETLARHGVDLEASNSTTGETLLHTAGSPEIVAFLLDRGLDPNARTAEGDTPLHTCCVGTAERGVSHEESQSK